MSVGCVLVLDEHPVLGGDDLVDRGEVAGAAACRGVVADLAPGQPEQGSEQWCGDQEGELVAVRYLK